MQNFLNLFLNVMSSCAYLTGSKNTFLIRNVTPSLHIVLIQKTYTLFYMLSPLVPFQATLCVSNWIFILFLFHLKKYIIGVVVFYIRCFCCFLFEYFFFWLYILFIICVVHIFAILIY